MVAATTTTTTTTTTTEGEDGVDLYTALGLARDATKLEVRRRDAKRREETRRDETRRLTASDAKRNDDDDDDDDADVMCRACVCLYA
jgi:hypothetical protein